MSKKKEPRFKKGDRIWSFDQTYNVYVDRRTGKKTTSPVFREYFKQFKVVDVLVNSYILELPNTAPYQKAIAKVDRDYKSDVEREAMIWATERVVITEMVRGASLELLKEVAKVINYQPDLEP